MVASRRTRVAPSLREYRRKRDFRTTAEPAGNARAQASKGLRFVVQKHAASRLHYDFRLEHAGTLKSWAVPKGPSLDPDVKRLAVQVEDHPIEYLDFEGTIPKGEYGGGTVMVWDIGAWRSLSDDVAGDLKRGRLKFELHGKRLRGVWSLFRISRGDSAAASAKPQWLLRKDDDRFASSDSGDDGEVIERYTTSALSRRSMDSIAAGRNGAAVWRSDGAPGAKRPAQRASKTAAKKGDGAASRKRSAKASRAVSRSKASSISSKANGLPLTISNPDRKVYPEEGITKADLAWYYHDVAEWMLPQVADRPISLLRCPQGRGKPCFVQKHPHAGYPDAIHSIPIRDKGGTEPYIYVDDAAGLVAAVQMGAMEIHPWGSRIASLELADYVVFDLDPGPGVTWKRVVEAAVALRRELDKAELPAFVRTSGGKGLHVVAPLMAGVKWDQARELSKTIAQLVAARRPGDFAATMSKSKRAGRIFIDYLRNSRGATCVASYSTRAREHAPVATPVSWTELPRLSGAAHFTVRNIRKRLSRLRNDPWSRFRLPRQKP